MCGPEFPLFTPLLLFARVPFPHFKQKHQFTRPFLRKFGNFIYLYSLNFCPNFSSQAPKFGNFSSQALSLRGKYQFASPTSLPEKRLSAPLPIPIGVRQSENDFRCARPKKRCFRTYTTKWLSFTLLYKMASKTFKISRL